MNVSLEFDSSQNCYLRCSKNLYKTFKNSNSSKAHGIVLRQDGSNGKFYFSLKEDSVVDENVIFLNRIYGGHLGLYEGMVVLEEIERLIPVTDLTLSCSSADYSIVGLHKDLIEEELVNQTQIVKEGNPVIGFINSSINIKFMVTGVKPYNANLLNSYTKVSVSIDDSSSTKKSSSDNCSTISSTVLKLSCWDPSLTNPHIPELNVKCFCSKSNLSAYLVLVCKVTKNSSSKILCSLNCCQKCLAVPSNVAVMAEQTLSFYFQLNEVVTVHFLNSNCQYESIDLQVQEMPLFDAPIFGSAVNNYSIITTMNNYGWKIDISIEGNTPKIVKKQELESQRSDTHDGYNPHGLVYESLVDKVLQSFPFSQKSLSLLSSKTQCFGAGKTYLLKRLASDQRLGNFFVLYSDATLFRGKRVDNVVKEITDLLNESCFNQPAILLLDNLDSVLPARSKNEEPSGDEIFGTRLADKLVSIFRTYKENNVDIVFSCQSVSSCHPLLMDASDAVYLLPMLSVTQYLPFLNSLLNNEVERTALQNCYEKLSLRSNLSVGEIVKLSKIVKSKIIDRFDSSNESQIFECCSFFDLQKIKPVTGHLKLSDCGGLMNVKEEIDKMLILPFKHPYLFSQIPFQLNRGLLLFGPPGVGKTLIIKGVANELNMNFLNVKGPELLNKYIGASEEAVRSLFRKAEEMSPTLIFFDEFDSLAPCRGNDTTGVMDRVVNQLLTELDGVSKHESVFIIAATSRPDAIDPAILRPGRIGRKVLCPLPGPSERAEIWDCLLRNTKHESNINTSVLGAETAFYSGADIKAIIYNAQLSLVKKTIATPNEKPAILHQELLLETISHTRPSLSQSDIKDYESKYNDFLSGRTSVGWKTTQR